MEGQGGGVVGDDTFYLGHAEFEVRWREAKEVLPGRKFQKDLAWSPEEIWEQQVFTC